MTTTGGVGARPAEAVDEVESILILDDNRSFAENVAEMAALEGHTSTLAFSLKEARLRLEERGYGVAILDQRLSDGLGTDFLGELNRRLPDVVAVLVTAYSSFETTVEALHQGAFAFVTKDSDPEEFLATLRRAVETARLRRENRTLRLTQDALFEAVPDTLILVDGMLRVRVVNASHPLFCRVDPERAVGSALKDVVQPEVWESHDWPAILSDGGQPLLQLNHEGRVLSFSVRAVRLPVQHAALTLVRITETTALMDLQHRVGEAERLASLGRLASTIAHQLRNPIAGIRALTQTLGAHLRPGDEDHDSLVEILRLTDRATATLADLLEFARPARSEPQVTDAARMVEDVVREVAAGRADAAGIRVHVEARLQVHVTRDRIVGALVSLLENALDASAGAPASITAQGLDHACEFCVEDSGDGVAAQDAELIFEPFFTRKVRGTGLGLFIARKAIEDDGGTVEVGRSESLGGACFRLRLPLAPQAHAEEASRDAVGRVEVDERPDLSVE